MTACGFGHYVPTTSVNSWQPHGDDKTPARNWILLHLDRTWLPVVPCFWSLCSAMLNDASHHSKVNNYFLNHTMGSLRHHYKYLYVTEGLGKDEF